ncbi:MAG TPA: hypothetical protein VFJ74_16525 [Gemmatimonadaceae bacterium]|nr:hypothetical protein [Gemmatimonadaceae bacterium]
MDHDRLERLPDDYTGFHTKAGERWKHKDFEEARTGAGYRLFISDRGERRRYDFGPRESHDATLLDLREQLEQAKPMGAATGGAGEGEETRTS